MKLIRRLFILILTSSFVSLCCHAKTNPPRRLQSTFGLLIKAETTRQQSRKPLSSSSALIVQDDENARASWNVVPRGGGGGGSNGSLASWLIPSKQATARFANVVFWVIGLTSATDGTKAWAHTGLSVARGSLAEWFSERHGWILLSMGILIALTEYSNLNPTQRVVVSYIPSLFHLFATLYSGRFKGMNIGSTVPIVLLLHHVVLLLTVLWFNASVPSWTLDGPFWLSALATILFPTRAMQSWGVDTTTRSTLVDKVMWIFQGHADTVYAAVIRASLGIEDPADSLAPGEVLSELMKWCWTAWLATIAVFQALRMDLARQLGIPEATMLVSILMVMRVIARLYLK